MVFLNNNFFFKLSFMGFNLILNNFLLYYNKYLEFILFFYQKILMKYNDVFFIEFKV